MNLFDDFDGIIREKVVNNEIARVPVHLLPVVPVRVEPEDMAVVVKELSTSVYLVVRSEGIAALLFLIVNIFKKVDVLYIYFKL